MNLIIKINLDNAAFEDKPEAELENCFEQVYLGLNPSSLNMTWMTQPEFNLRDSNGNTVGTVVVTG